MLRIVHVYNNAMLCYAMQERSRKCVAMQTVLLCSRDVDVRHRERFDAGRPTHLECRTDAARKRMFRPCAEWFRCESNESVVR